MRRRRMVIGGVAAVVVVGVVATTYAINSTGSAAAARYRTTTATRGDLTATVSLGGTLAHVDSVTAAFPTTGAVTSVSVRAGQQVTAGEVLATMDTAPLRAALLEAQSQVAAVQLAIEQDRAALDGGTPAGTTPGLPQTAVPGAGASGRPGAPTVPAGAGTSGPAAGGAMSPEAHVSAALGAVDAAQTAVNTSCTDLLSGLGQGVAGAPGSGRPAAPVADRPSPSGSPQGSASATPTPTPTTPSTPPATASPSPTASPTASPSGTPTPTATPTAAFPTVDPQALTSCMGALEALSTAQHRAALALDAGGTALAQQARSQQALSQQATALAGGAGATPTLPSGLGGGFGQTGGGTSAKAKLLSDQATLAVVQQQQTQAQNNLDAATLTAPISGVVGAVDISPGNQATPTRGIVIIGPGAARVDATATLGNLQQIAVGDRVEVRTVGSATPLDGTLTAVGALPTSGAGTDAPSYPVVVSVPAGAAGLPEGAPSTASIVTTSLTGALVIPSSALVTSDTGATTVTVLSSGATRTVDVSVGARGQGRVQVLSGIGAADTIVLADLVAPLPAPDFAAFRGGPDGGSSASPAPSGSPSPR